MTPSKNRRPRVFAPDDPALNISGAPEPEPQHAAGSPGNGETRSDKSVSDGAASTATRRPTVSELRRGIGWGGLLLSSLTGLAMLGIGAWFARLVSAALARDDLVGWTAYGLLIVSARGQAARFSESAVKPQGRQTRGVRAINLGKDDRVLSLCVAQDDEDLLVVTGNGYGKRTPVAEYAGKGRPTKGVRTIRVSDKKGELVTARRVREGTQLLLVSQGGQVIRIDVDAVKRMGRSTEGVRLMVLKEDDRVASVATVVESETDADEVDVVLDGAPAVDAEAAAEPADADVETPEVDPEA